VQLAVQSGVGTFLGAMPRLLAFPASLLADKPGEFQVKHPLSHTILLANIQIILGIDKELFDVGPSKLHYLHITKTVN